jgi:hypothetical protein
MGSQSSSAIEPETDRGRDYRSRGAITVSFSRGDLREVEGEELPRSLDDRDHGCASRTLRRYEGTTGTTVKRGGYLDGEEALVDDFARHSFGSI